MQQEAIEAALWEYIDGMCTADEAARIQSLVQTDAVWKQAYDELLEVQAFAANASAPEEPSMRFTKNIMEALAAVAPVRKYINKWVVKGIAAFFLLAIVASVAFTAAQLDMSIPTQVSDPVKAHQLTTAQQHTISEMLKNVFVPVTILLLLVFADGLRRRRSGRISGL